VTVVLDLAIATLPAHQGRRAALFVVRPSRGAFTFLPLRFMDDTQNTIGLMELLDEISRDLDELRKKHAGDYGMKNLTMWWELERDRLLVRHDSARIIRRRRRLHGIRRTLALFAAASLTTVVVQTAIRLLVA
jgi:hypothetical protein